MKESTFKAVCENLDAVLNFVNAELEVNECAAKTQHQIAIAVEEIFVNIANYAYQGETGDAVIRVEVTDGVLRLVFEDSGIPYNPLEKADPNISASAEDRPIGGLGIFMVKKIMDTVEYRYEDNKNKLIMIKVVK